MGPGGQLNKRLPQTRAEAVRWQGNFLLPAGLDKLGLQTQRAGDGYFAHVPEHIHQIDSRISSELRLLVDSMRGGSDWGVAGAFTCEVKDQNGEPRLRAERSSRIQEIPDSIRETVSKVLNMARGLKFRSGSQVTVSLLRPAPVAKFPHLDPAVARGVLAHRGIRFSFTSEPGTLIFDTPVGEGHPGRVVNGTMFAPAQVDWVEGLADHPVYFPGEQGAAVFETPPGDGIIMDIGNPPVHASSPGRSWILNVDIVETWNSQEFEAFHRRFLPLAIPDTVRHKHTRHR